MFPNEQEQIIKSHYTIDILYELRSALYADWTAEIVDQFIRIEENKIKYLKDNLEKIQ